MNNGSAGPGRLPASTSQAQGFPSPPTPKSGPSIQVITQLPQLPGPSRQEGGSQVLRTCFSRLQPRSPTNRCAKDISTGVGWSQAGRDQPHKKRLEVSQDRSTLQQARVPSCRQTHARGFNKETAWPH